MDRRPNRVAPSRDQVVAELPQCIHECAPPEIWERLSWFVQGAPRKQRMWLARFWKRWGLGYGTLKAQVCVEEKRHKVALTEIICGVQLKVGSGMRSGAVANLGQFAVPNLGPRGGPKFGTPGTKNVKAGPKLSLSDGTRFGPSIRPN